LPGQARIAGEIDLLGAYCRVNVGGLNVGALEQTTQGVAQGFAALAKGSCNDLT
jgi:hypothetical protein